MARVVDDTEKRIAPWAEDWTDTAPGRLRGSAELALGLEGVREEMARLLPAAAMAATPRSSARRLSSDRRGRPGLLDVGALGRFARPAAADRGRDARTSERPIYAVGDVHGCYELLTQLIARIAADAAALAPAAQPILVLCGDYVDRGPDPARVLEALCWLRQWQGWEVHLLKGNHEQGLLRFLDEPAGGAPWIRFGGATTLRSYGVEAPDEAAPTSAWVTARDELLRRMPAAHLRLLQTLELMIVIGDHAFVHAGVAPGTPLSKQQEGDLLWIRDEFLHSGQAFERIIVHGHSWVDDQPVLEANRIGLDTGAYATGALTAVRIADGRTHTLQVRDPASAPWPRSQLRRDDRPRLVKRPADFSRLPGDDTLRVCGAPAALRTQAPGSRVEAAPVAPAAAKPDLQKAHC